MDRNQSTLLIAAVAVLVNFASGSVCWAADEKQPAVKTTALSEGHLVPAFESIDDSGQAWKSSDHVGKGVLVLYFYPGDFTGGCIKQAEAYRDGLEKIKDLRAEVVGVSGDEVATHALFKETYGLKQALLADTQGELAKLLGISVNQGGHVRAMKPDRTPLLDAEGKPLMLSRPTTLERWTVVVDRDGKVASMRQVKNPVKDIEEVIKIVEQLRK